MQIIAETIKIFSDSAIYNTVNFDTQFSQQHRNYLWSTQQQIVDFAALIFTNNLAVSADNVVYQNKLTIDTLDCTQI